MPRQFPGNEAVPNRQPTVREKVRVEQMRMVFANGAVATAASTVFALALAWQVQGYVSRHLLLVWLALKMGAAAPRLLFGLMFERRKNDSLQRFFFGRALLVVAGSVLVALAANWLRVASIIEIGHVTAMRSSLIRSRSSSETSAICA